MIICNIWGPVLPASAPIFFQRASLYNLSFIVGCNVSHKALYYCTSLIKASPIWNSWHHWIIWHTFSWRLPHVVWMQFCAQCEKARKWCLKNQILNLMIVYKGIVFMANELSKWEVQAFRVSRSDVWTRESTVDVWTECPLVTLSP